MKPGIWIILVFLFVLTVKEVVYAHKGAGFWYRGEGATLQFDPEGLPEELLPGYKLLKANCTKCHSQERIVRHLQDSISKGEEYESNLKELITKKLRMSSNISRAEGKGIMDFLLILYRIELLEHAKLR